MANAIGRRRIAPVAPVDFEKSRYLTHIACGLSQKLLRPKP
jgi:hypothetical protein